MKINTTILVQIKPPEDFNSSGSGLHSEGKNNTNTGDDDYQADDSESNDDSDSLDISHQVLA